MNFLPAGDIVVNRRQGIELGRLANDQGKAAPKLSFHEYLTMALQHSFNHFIITKKLSGIITASNTSIHLKS